MASKVNIIVTADFADLANDINADITTEQGNGFAAVDVEIEKYVDQDTGDSLAIAVITYDSSAANPTSENLNPESSELMQQTTVTGAASTLTSMTGSPTHVLVTVEGASCRIRFDGTDPTASVGHFFEVGASAVWSAQTYAAAKAIRTGAVDATIFASPFVG